MKPLSLLLTVGALGAAVVWQAPRIDQALQLKTKLGISNEKKPELTAAQLKEACRNRCLQSGAVEGLPEDAVGVCLQRCNLGEEAAGAEAAGRGLNPSAPTGAAARSGAAARPERPYEPVSRITRAPANHQETAPRKTSIKVSSPNH